VPSNICADDAGSLRRRLARRTRLAELVAAFARRSAT
jgi:hypothetical protein